MGIKGTRVMSSSFKSQAKRKPGRQDWTGDEEYRGRWINQGTLAAELAKLYSTTRRNAERIRYMLYELTEDRGNYEKLQYRQSAHITCHALLDAQLAMIRYVAKWILRDGDAIDRFYKHIPKEEREDTNVRLASQQLMHPDFDKEEEK